MSTQPGDVNATMALAAESMTEPPTDPLIGRHIGPYAIRERIGVGGMGNVYRTVRMEDFSVQVAIKLIRRGMDSEEILGRFRDEMQFQAALARLHSDRSGEKDKGGCELSAGDRDPVGRGFASCIAVSAAAPPIPKQPCDRLCRSRSCRRCDHPIGGNGSRLREPHGGPPNQRTADVSRQRAE